MKELKVLGSYAYTDGDFQKALAIMERGKIRVDDWMDIVPLADGHVAINRLIDHPDRWVKVILEP